MLSLAWHLEYALRTIRREGRRALLAILCLSTGIALLVSLQTLGLALVDSLAANGQQLLGADLTVVNQDKPFDTHSQQPFAFWRASGELVDYTTIYATQILAKKGDQTSLFEVRVVDPDKYPLYGQIELAYPPGASFSALLKQPDAIVLSEQVAKRLDLQVDDTLQITVPRARVFRIAGIIPNRSDRPLMFNTASLLGVGYLSRQSATRILPPGERDQSDRVLIKTASAAQTAALVTRIQALSKSYQVQVADTELARTVENLQGLQTLLQYIGLLALLTSGVAIADTMLAMVTRRQDEIAILKTLGLKGFDLAVLFAVEALLRGFIGSVIGIVLGLGLSLAVEVLAEQLVGQPVQWRIYPGPIENGLVVGPLTALAFSLLSILTASGIRPLRLMRRQVVAQPRRSFVAMAGVILCTVGLMGVLAGALLGDLMQGEITAFAGFGALLLLVLVFFVLLWLAELVLRVLGRLSLNLQLAVRNLARRRLRSAIMLTTLTTGVFAIALITVLAGFVRDGFIAQMNQQLGYNLVVFLPHADANREERTQLQAVPGLLELAPGNQAASDLVRVNDIAAAKLIEARREELDQTYSYGAWRSIYGRELSGPLPDVKVTAGRALTVQDNGRRVLLAPDVLAEALGLQVGDELALTVSGKPVSFTIVGIFKQGNWNVGGWGFITSRQTVTSLSPRAGGVYRLRVKPEELEHATRFVTNALPETFAFGTGDMAAMVINLLDRLALLPMLLAALTLLVGSVMIANSVSLGTLQRYEEIGILKALGATGARVLSLIWLENNLIGLLGAGIGLGLAVVGARLVGPGMLEGSDTLIPLDKTGLLIPFVAALLVTSGATLLAVLPLLHLRPAAALRND